MASVQVPAPARQADWTRLPWPLIGAGIGLCLLALALALGLKSPPGPWRLGLLSVGLICVGSALASRLGTSGPAFFARAVAPSRGPLLLALAGLFALIAATATAIVVLTFFDLPWLPWGTGEALAQGVVIVPLAALTARRASQLRAQNPVPAAAESAVMLLLAAAACGISCWALYVPADPESWDTMRLALGVFAVVALVATPLPLASVRVRRFAVSTLVLLHFAAIGTATLSAPPTPWLMGQLWARVTRPYLEFVYLNNAYHFYAPEPGPSTYVWFRVIYANAPDLKADLPAQEFGIWFKLPDVDDKGRHRHNAAVEYQRYLALTENIIGADATPSFITVNAQGTQGLVDFFRIRQEHAPTPGSQVITIGRPAPKVIVPFHTSVPIAQQYSRPNVQVRRLLSSFVRHVASVKGEPPADLPGYALQSIKVYRVRHETAPAESFKWDPPLSPNDPQLYHAYYMGRYDQEGRLLDDPLYDQRGKLERAGDPFLYWLLPTLREQNAADLLSPVHDYAREHAGDPNCYYLPDRAEWVDKQRALRAAARP